jgi:hypothetical protein
MTWYGLLLIIRKWWDGIVVGERCLEAFYILGVIRLRFGLLQVMHKNSDPYLDTHL